MLVAAVRELFGSGSMFGVEVLPLVTNGGWYSPMGLMLLPPSAFFIIGGIIWAIRAWKKIKLKSLSTRLVNRQRFLRCKKNVGILLRFICSSCFIENMALVFF